MKNSVAGKAVHSDSLYIRSSSLGDAPSRNWVKYFIELYGTLFT